MAYGTQITPIGTKVVDAYLLNSVPITASGASRTAASAAALRVTPPVYPPDLQQIQQSSSDLSTGCKIVTPALGLSNRYRLFFAMCHATDPATLVANVSVFGIRRLKLADVQSSASPRMTANHFEEISPLILDLSITCGGNLIPTAPVSASPSLVVVPPATLPVCKWVSVITKTNDYSRAAGALVYHAATDNVAVIDFDKEGYEYLRIEGVPAAASGLFIFGEEL